MHAQVALVAGLLLAAPVTFAQKMYKCPDGKGGTTFQQMPCADTAEEIEARKKEKERLEAEAKRKKEEEARKKEESVQKARERDKAYQEEAEARAEAQKKAAAAEARMVEGTTKEKKERAFDDGTLPPGFETSHPGAWRDTPNPDIASTLAKNKTPSCPQYRYRQRANGLPEYVVQCTVDKRDWVTYFVWPNAGAVKGPAKF